jgi:hypothetical protein
MEEEWIDINTYRMMCKEEWLAFQIWLTLYDYYADNFDNDAAEITEEFMNSLNFDILSKEDMSQKNHIICFPLMRPLNIDSLHEHLFRNGINKNFDNKITNKDSRIFATIWI